MYGAHIIGELIRQNRAGMEFGQQQLKVEVHPLIEKARQPEDWWEIDGFFDLQLSVRSRAGVAEITEALVRSLGLEVRNLTDAPKSHGIAVSGQGNGSTELYIIGLGVLADLFERVSEVP